MRTLLAAVAVLVVAGCGHPAQPNDDQLVAAQRAAEARQAVLRGIAMDTCTAWRLTSRLAARGEPSAALAWLEQVFVLRKRYVGLRARVTFSGTNGRRVLAVAPGKYICGASPWPGRSPVPRVRRRTMTNATKALIITVLNAGTVLAVSFGVDLSHAQDAALSGFENAVLGLWVALTYKNSSKRTPDA